MSTWVKLVQYSSAQNLEFPSDKGEPLHLDKFESQFHVNLVEICPFCSLQDCFQLTGADSSSELLFYDDSFLSSIYLLTTGQISTKLAKKRLHTCIPTLKYIQCSLILLRMYMYHTTLCNSPPLFKSCSNWGIACLDVSAYMHTVAHDLLLHAFGFWKINKVLITQIYCNIMHGLSKESSR